MATASSSTDLWKCLNEINSCQHIPNEDQYQRSRDIIKAQCSSNSPDCLTRDQRARNSLALLQYAHAHAKDPLLVFYLVTQLKTTLTRQSFPKNKHALDDWITSHAIDESAAKHAKLLHEKYSNPQGTPVHLLPTIGEVLSACGIDRSLLDDWDWLYLQKVQNARRCHTTTGSRIASSLASESPSLPIFGQFLCDLYLHVCNKGVPDDAEVFKATELQRDFTAADWRTLIPRILDGKENALRILNVPTHSVVDELTAKGWQTWSEDFIQGCRKFRPSWQPNTFPANANITPRDTRTEVHHDSDPHVAIAIGRHQGLPLKLWIMWPPKELDKLPRCHNNTATALSMMENAEFFVQLHGESFAVRENTPHAVLALNDTILYGHQYRPMEARLEPCGIHVDIAAGVPESEAVARRLSALEQALPDREYRDLHMNEFLQSWVHSGRYFLEDPNRLDDLVDIFEKDAGLWRECIWCFHTGHKLIINASNGQQMIREHILEHLSPKQLNGRGHGMVTDADDESESEFELGRAHRGSKKRNRNKSRVRVGDTRSSRRKHK